MKARARWASCLLLGLFACSSDITPLTQIVVVVDSDLEVPTELNALSIDVSPAKGTSSAMASLTDVDDLPRSLGIVNSGTALGPVRVTVQGWLGDMPVVTRTAEVWFRKDKSVRLSLRLTRACRDLLAQCDDGRSCDDGACVDEAIADLPAWTGKLPPHSSMTMSDGDGGEPPAADGGDASAAARGGDGGGDSGRSGSGGPSGGSGASGNDADNQPPVCTIDEPAAGAHFYAGDSIAFRGSCADPDGAAPETVTWRSNIDDAIGFAYSTHFMLSAGTHTIAFCGADRRDPSLPGCSNVMITVDPLPDVTASITSVKQGNAIKPPYSADSAVTAIGSASGLEPLTLRWTDSLIGELGGDPTQTLPPPITVGKHALALTVTDARKRTAGVTSANFNVFASGQTSLFEKYNAVNAVLMPKTGTAIGPVVALDADTNYIYAAAQGNLSSALLKVDRSNTPDTASPVLVTLSVDPAQQLRDVSLHAASGRAYLALSSGYESCNYSLAGGIDMMNCTTSKSQSDKPCATGDTTRIVRVTSSGSGKDYVLLGTPFGLCVCDATNVGNCELSSQVSSVNVSGFAVAGGTAWIATNAGLYKIDLSTNDGVMNPSKIDAAPASLTGLALGDNGLWIGSATGVTRMDPSNSHTSFWGTSTSAGAFQHLISSDIRAVAVSRPSLGSSGPRDVAWIATSAGVSRFDSTVPSFTSFTVADGLPSNTVRAVLVLSSGDKVFGTDSGLALYRGP
jgi:hypothetical protein